MATPTRNPPKRGNGSGGKPRRVPNRPGLWRADVSLGFDRDGKRIRQSLYGPTKTDVERQVREALTDHGRGVLAAPESITVREYAERWLARQTSASDRTRDLYRQELAYALEHLGDLKVQKVQPHHVKDTMTALAARTMVGGRGRGKTMAVRTQSMILSRVRAVFREAVVDRIIHASPVEGVRRVKAPPAEAVSRVLDLPEAVRLVEVGRALEEARVCRLWPALFLALNLGLRRGEVMGLRWEDVDLDRGLLRVRHALTAKGGKPVLGKLKTRTSRREVHLPASVTLSLRAHLGRQQLEREAIGDGWRDTGAVFATELGTWTHPDNLNRALASVLDWSDSTNLGRRMRAVPGAGSDGREAARLRAVVSAGEALPRITVHDLRHTYATLALRGGVQAEVVSKILGHARVSVTMDIYRHVLESERQRAAIDLFAIVPQVSPTSERRVSA